MTIKREVAKKCRIRDILNGRYVKREGWEVNYFDTEIGRISRANILAAIVSENQGALTAEDGTGQIQLRNFDENKKFDVSVGDVVLVIGRPREFNEQKYIATEIIKKINDLKWIECRFLELKNIKYEPKKEEENKEIKPNPIINISEAVLRKIIELDKGFGVKISDVMMLFNQKEANKTINQLIETGEIFELKPGIVKAL